MVLYRFGVRLERLQILDKLATFDSTQAGAKFVTDAGVSRDRCLKLALTPFSFPEGPVRVKKFSAEPGSVPLSFMTE
jgi:hypothetical protein